MSGRFTSSTTTSGWVCIASSACRPVAASSTSNPAERRMRALTYRFASVSSTTSTRGAGRVASAICRLLGAHVPRHDEREAGADADLALERDAAAQEGGEL